MGRVCSAPSSALMFDQSVGLGLSLSAARGSGRRRSSRCFFATTFELMGHVAKSDGRVSEAEIDAARAAHAGAASRARTRSAPRSNVFGRAKQPAYDASLRIEQLREACGLRYDLLARFIELQLRAALAGNGMSPPARAHAGARRRASRHVAVWNSPAWRPRAARAARRGAGPRGAAPADGRCRECYAELEVSRRRERPGGDQGVSAADEPPSSRTSSWPTGCPSRWREWAKEKTQRIQEAYEAIRAARGMR